jgi:hypothetical protein
MLDNPNTRTACFEKKMSTGIVSGSHGLKTQRNIQVYILLLGPSLISLILCICVLAMFVNVSRK